MADVPIAHPNHFTGVAMHAPVPYEIVQGVGELLLSALVMCLILLLVQNLPDGGDTPTKRKRVKVRSKPHD